jgi:hypothetical protein
MTMHVHGTGERLSTSVSPHVAYYLDYILTAVAEDSFFFRLKKAIAMQKKQRKAFVKFNATFPSDVVRKWEKMVVEWDADRKKKNPYEEPVAGTSVAEVRLELAKEEADDVQRGNQSIHHISASRWLTMGLDLEEQQYANLPSEFDPLFILLYYRRVLVWHSSRKKTTTLAAADLQEKRNSLRHRIESWQDIQKVYMPCVERLREARAHSPHTVSSTPSGPSSMASSSPLRPENVPLYLPSSIPRSLWTSGCSPGLVEKERRLRLAQADDGLDELRRQLRISATLIDYKKEQHSSSQRMGTRTHVLLSRFRDKTHRAAERYTAAFDALLVLDPGGDWSVRLKCLDHSKDLRSPRRDPDEDPSENRRQLSWIWLVQTGNGLSNNSATSDEINDSKSIHRTPINILTLLTSYACGMGEVKSSCRPLV